MKISMVIIGSRGDVQPCVALGVGLQRAGQQVHLITHNHFQEFVESYGLGFTPLPGNVMDLMEKAMKPGLNVFEFFQAGVDFFGPLIDENIQQTWDGCQGSALILFNTFSVAAYNTAEKLGIPCMRMALQPLYRTRYSPSPLAARLPLGAGYNSFTHWMTDMALHWATLRPMNAWRVRQQLKPFSPFRTPYLDQQSRPIPVLMAYSPHVAPAYPDWGEHVHVTGYWHLDQSTQWRPPQALEDFLAAGAPPVYFGFGSMVGEDFEGILSVILEALHRTHQRGLLLTGWGDLGERQLPQNVFRLPSADHDWLFPHMGVIVHHGGAGTTAASLRAGIPTIVIPFYGDQSFWGERVVSLGVGAGPIPRKQLTVERLVEAIQQAIQPAVRQRAQALGQVLRAEDGVQCAVDVILEQLEHH